MPDLFRSRQVKKILSDLEPTPDPNKPSIAPPAPPPPPATPGLLGAPGSPPLPQPTPGAAPLAPAGAPPPLPPPQLGDGKPLGKKKRIPVNPTTPPEGDDPAAPGGQP